MNLFKNQRWIKYLDLFSGNAFLIWIYFRFVFTFFKYKQVKNNWKSVSEKK